MAQTLFDALLAGDPQIARRPHAAYEPIAAQEDLYWSEKWQSWIVTRYDDVKAVLRDTLSFSSRSCADPPLGAIEGYAEIEVLAKVEGGELGEFVKLMEGGRRQTLLTADPPVHSSLRQPMLANLSVSAVRSLEEGIRATMIDILAQLPAEGTIDFVRSVAVPLPLQIVGDFLGIPRDARSAFREIADSANFGRLTPETARLVLKGEEQVRAYFIGQIERAEPGGTSFLNDLRKRCDAGSLSLEDAAGLCREVVVAGNESTRFVLIAAVIMLLSDPVIERALRADAALIDAFVDEVLRLKPPFMGFWRRATKNVALRGTTIKKGDALYLAYVAANRDPTYFADPHALNLQRHPPCPHFAFGFGAHFCVGMHLAKTELKVALRMLLAELAVIEMRSHPDSIPYLPDPTMHGATELSLFIKKKLI